jgi:simple sugar transport system ATP-binding protein
VLGLLGENGAGKTTLMNILAGVYLPDGGTVHVGEVVLALGSPKAAVDAGVGMVHQHLKLVETLTAMENISLAVHHGRFLQPRRLPDSVLKLKEDLGFQFDLSSRVWQLPLAQRQQLEILRVLATEAKVVILDEPSAVLSPPETDKLFEIIRRIAASGRAVVLISHKLEEVLGVADVVAVMRAGRMVHEGPSGGLTVDTLARLMVGDRMSAGTGRPDSESEDVLLSVADLAVDDDLDYEVVHSVSFEVRRGELVALVGVAGNGQEQLMEAIGGLRAIRVGEVETFAGGRARRHGFAHVPAERLGVGLAPGLTLRDNALLGSQRSAPFGRWLRRRHVSFHTTSVLERFGVVHSGSGPVRNLSGGNLQRIILGRELMKNEELLIAS